MLRSIRSLYGYRLSASDGEIGHCRDFLFDDRDWVIRYMVADTGGWLGGRKVLISPLALREPDWETKHFPVELSRQQIEDSPPLDEHAPVSRQYEIAYHSFFSLPFYWSGHELWGTYPDPRGVLHPVTQPPQTPAEDLPVKEGHLRSCEEVAHYQVEARDGEIEEIEDFIADDATWALRFFVVDTRRWLPGGHVLIPTHRLAGVDWSEQRVKCHLSVDQIKHGPAYDPAYPVNAEYEERLYDYYGRPRS